MDDFYLFAEIQPLFTTQLTRRGKVHYKLQVTRLQEEVKEAEGGGIDRGTHLQINKLFRCLASITGIMIPLPSGSSRPISASQSVSQSVRALNIIG